MDSRDYARKTIYKLYFHCGLLKKQNVGTIRIKTDAKSHKKWRAIILRLFDNINIKHYNIMNSRKTNWKLIENITVEVPIIWCQRCNDTLFHVSKFLEKMVFQLTFEIIKWICQLQGRQQTVPNYWHQIGHIFWPEHMFDVVFAWFWPDFLYISWKYRGQVSLKNLVVLFFFVLFFGVTSCFSNG